MMGAFGDAASEILMKLVLKGIEPTEAARLANQPLHALEGELNASLARQVAAHRAASEAQTGEAQKAAKAEVREALNKTKEISSAIQTIERETARAARGMSSNWRRVAEDLENVTVVATGAWGIIAGGAGRLKAFGDSIAQTTNIYASLKGSIETMREASKGQIADIDLITTKNRAAQKELELTDEQFGLVAASADAFADALGTSTKDALDGLIDGLATGRTRSLAMAGVVIDEKEAFDAYAKKVNRATETLSDHEKLVAKVEASLRAMDKKLAESAGGVENFGDKWDETNAKISNLSDEIKLSLGGAISGLYDLLFEDLPSYIAQFLLQWEITFKKVADLSNKFNPLAANTNYAAAPQAELQGLLQNRANAQTAAADAAAKQIADAKDRQRRDTNPQMADLAIFGGKGLPYDASHAVGGDTTRGKAKEIKLTAMQQLFAGFKKQGPFDQEAEDVATNVFDTLQKKLEEVFGEKSLFTPEEKARILSQPWKELPDKTMGVDFLRAIGWDTETVAEEDAKLDGEIEKRLQAVEDKILSETIKVQEEIEATLKQNKKDVGGLLSLFFGDDFLSQSREEMSQLENIAIDSAKQMNGMLKDAGEQFAGAVGDTLAHSVGEFTDTAQAYEVYASSVGKKASELTDAERARVKAYADNQNSMANVLKRGTHDVLMNLSAQAFSKAALAAGEALFALASGNPASAAGFAASAAAFTAAGLAAGGLARATFTPGSESAPYLTGSRPTESRTGGAAGSGGAGGGGGGSSSDSSPISVTIVMKVPPGGEAESGRSVLKSLEALKAETGIDIAKRLAA